MKRLLLLLFFPIVLFAQNTTKGTIISGPAAARPTCSATFNATTANTGDIYNDSDDVNIWKCSGGSWSVLGGGLTGVQNNGVTATPEPFINFISPFVVTTNSGNTSNDITCSIMVAAGAGHAAGCVGDPGAVAHGTPYYWGENGIFNAIPSSVASAAIKPDPATAIQYVAGTCTGGVACVDGNDGLSSGNAKLTISAALLALPGGGSTFSGSGTVYAGLGAVANAAGAQYGIWLMASSDPNYASPPTGWLKCNGCTVTITGVSNSNNGPNAHKGRVLVSAGSGSDTAHPAVWISGTQTPIVLQNLAFQYPGRAFVIGECSDRTRTNTCSVAGITLENDTGNLNALATNGPCTDITGASFWIWLRDFGCGGLAAVATGGRTADNAAAILIDGGGNNGNGLIYISDTNLALGGIKFKPGGTTPGVLYVTNVDEEGDFTHDIPPVVWITAGLPVEGNISGLQIVDPGPTNTPAFQNDAGGTAMSLLDIAGTAPPTGGGVVLNQPSVNFVNSTVNPLTQSQVGFFNGYVKGETDVARRIAGLTPGRFANNANNNSGTWTLSNSGGTTVITGQSDPYGGTTATKLTFNTSAVQTAQLGPGPSPSTCPSYTSTTGQWLVAGVWEQGMSPTQDIVTIGCYGVATPTYSVRYTNAGLQVGQPTDWQFRWVAEKETSSAATQIAMKVNYSNAVTPTIFGPVMFIIPAGTLSDNEVLEFASSMNSVDFACAVGSICNVAGHPVSADVFTERAITAPTGASGITQHYMDSTTNWPSFKPNGNTAYSTAGFLASAPVDQDCVKWLVSGGVKTLGDAGAACGSGGGGSGTITASLLNSFTYYSGAGTSTTVNGVNGLTAPIGVFGFLGSIPQAGNLAGTPVQLLAGISGRTSTVASGTTANIINTDRAHRVKHTNAGATTISLPGAGTTDFASNYCYKEKVEGTGASDTITPVAGTINGAASLTMLQGQAALVCSYDNSNYEADVLEVGGLIAGTNITLTRTDFGGLTIASTSGGGTVTHTAGALTSGQLVIGNAAADVKVGDLSGDTHTSGSTVTVTDHVNGVSYGTSPSTNTVPVVTGTNVITYETVPNAALTNSSVTANGQTCTLGSTCNVNAGSTAHGVAVNEGNGAAIASTAVGAQNAILSGVTTADPTFKSLSDLSAETYGGTATGLVNVLAACPTRAATALTPGMVSSFLPNLANTTTAPTYNLCTLGPKTITKHGTAVLSVNDLTTIQTATVQYDGMRWQLQDPATEGGTGSTAVSSLIAAAASNTIANANFPQIWNNAQNTNSQAGMTFGETSAATNGTVTTNLANQSELAVITLPASTATPFSVSQGSVTGSVAYPALQVSTTWNNGASTFKGIIFKLTNTASNGPSRMEEFFNGTTSEWSLDAFGSVAQNGNLLASGIVDGKAPVTVTTGASATLGGTYNSGYTFNQNATAATAITYTLPTAAAGLQYCVGNSYNGSAATTGTLEILTSAAGQFIIFTDGTLSATGGFVQSGGAAADAACVVGVDTTHWMLYVQRGTWTKH